MGNYIPSTDAERREMLAEIGVADVRALYANVPNEVFVKQLDLPDGKSELEVRSLFEEIASENRVFKSIFRGAGAYNHYIPAIVKSVVGKEEFLTAYTPYQAEISQGILQSIFEYQTMICELTGMAVSNASVYDGATAAAESVAMCVGRLRTRALVSGALNPEYIRTIATYCEGSGTQLVVIPAKDGATDIDALKSALGDTAACVLVQSPNYFGVIEDAKAIGALAHGAGAKFVMSCNPISLGVLETPAGCGADIAVGEGQPLGMPLSFGGPYLGFMAADAEMMRRLPGRIVGETVDKNGERAFVLTLQAREQHIRREKASSNICSNQALCALTAAVYLASVGAEGLSRVASLCASKAHYAQKALCGVDGFKPVFGGEFFNEFVTTCPIDAETLCEKLEKKGILCGLPIKEGILWCVTELNSKQQIDSLVDAVKEACAQ